MKNRPGFPTIKHFDTWLFDQLQLISELIYGEVTLVPDWENTGLFIPTSEVFGIVPLFDEKAARESVEEAEEGIDDVDVNDMLSVPIQLSQKSIKFLCELMKTDIVYFPVDFAHERLLFTNLVSKHLVRSGVNFVSMSEEWNRLAYGVHIFKELPIHLKSFHTKFWKPASH